MNPTPLNPDALDHAIDAVSALWDGNGYCGSSEDLARTALTAYLAVAQPVVNSVESLPAKMSMLMWEGGEFEVGEIPDGHVLVGFEMETDRAWSMADKVTIHIERKDTTNGR